MMIQSTLFTSLNCWISIIYVFPVLPKPPTLSTNIGDKAVLKSQSIVLNCFGSTSNQSQVSYTLVRNGGDVIETRQDGSFTIHATSTAADSFQESFKCKAVIGGVNSTWSNAIEVHFVGKLWKAYHLLLPLLIINIDSRLCFMFVLIYYKILLRTSFFSRRWTILMTMWW